MAMTPIPPRDAPSPSATAQPVEKPPQPDDVARFEGALSQIDKDDRADVRQETSEQDRQSDDPSSLFRRREAPDRDKGGNGGSGDDEGASERAMAAFQGATSPAGMPPLAGPTAEAMTPSARVVALANEIVDAIQVAQDSPGAEEVRIQLNSAALGGSEIRLVNAGKALEVTFVCATKDTETFLLGRQAELSALLGERLGREVRVQVVDPSRDEPARTRSEADARGGGDGGQDHGRSRNRHLYDSGRDT